MWITPFDRQSVERAWPFADVIKVASGDLMNVNLATWIRDCNQLTEKPIVISSGAATVQEVNDALKGWYNWTAPMVLNCSSRYPAELTDYNLGWIDEVQLRGGGWGLSDHTTTTELACAAVALGCEVFEKHIRFGTTAPNAPDNGPWAATVTEFGNYVKTLNIIEQAVFTNEKPTTDFDERIGARRGDNGLRPNND